MAKRDSRGRVLPGTRLNPEGRCGVKRMSAEQFVRAFYGVLGEDCYEKIVKMGWTLAKKGNTTLLCKLLDKILPSKLESKEDLEITHREAFLSMRKRAMEILEAARYKPN